MADLSQSSVLGVKVETVSGTYSAPNTTTDLVVVADLRVNIPGIVADVREYTGSIHRPGGIFLGKTMEISGRLLLRGPGGATPPSADGWAPGRLIRAAGFTEVVQSAAVPVAAEALGAGGTTTSATLGTSAGTTADQYKGLALHLAALGVLATSGIKTMAMIRSYSAAKVATLARTLGAAPTGNYQIPKQLAYQLSASAPPSLSMSVWLGGRRYNGKGMAISSLRFNFPTASRDANEVPSMEFTLSGDFDSWADETSPVPTITNSPPFFRDGNLWIANKQLGGSSLSIDFNAQVGYPPNPNQASGNDAAQLVGTTRIASFTINQVAKATLDLHALADAQSLHAVELTYGAASGNSVGLIVPNARFNSPSPDNGGSFVTMGGEMMIDDVDKAISLVFPYY